MRKRLTLDLPEQIHSEFKTKCTSKGIIMRELIESFIIEWMRTQPIPEYMRDVYETNTSKIEDSI